MNNIAQRERAQLCKQLDVLVNDPEFMILLDEIPDLFRLVESEHPDLKKVA